MKGVACSMRRNVDAHFAGEIGVDDERRMRAHLADCDACRNYYGRRALLAKLDPEALGQEERIGRALGLRKRGSRSLRFVAGGAGVLVAAATIFLFVGTRTGTPEDGFAARGAGASKAPAASMQAELGRESRIEVYRVPRSGQPVSVARSLGRNDELAFAYRNGRGKDRLAIFGVDERGRVYWFHPAWTDEADDPVAIRVRRDPGLHELPEAIAHKYEGTRLDIHAVFLDEALSVREIEKRLASGGLNVTGAVEDVHSFNVMP